MWRYFLNIANLMTQQSSSTVSWHGLYYMVMGLGHILFGATKVPDWQHEAVYVIVLGCIVVALSIWYLTGAKHNLLLFFWATTFGRVFTGGVCIGFVLAGFAPIVSVLSAMGILDIASSWWTWQSLPVFDVELLQGEVNKELSVPEKTRLSFGFYLIVLSNIVLWCPHAFLEGFKMAPSNMYFVRLCGAMTMTLGLYNIIAGYFRQQALITAGIRGGFMVAIVFLCLVSAGLAHPITLLIPFVDILTYLIITVHKIAMRA